MKHRTIKRCDCCNQPSGNEPLCSNCDDAGCLPDHAIKTAADREHAMFCHWRQFEQWTIADEMTAPY